MQKQFLKAARLGDNHGWRYLLVTFSAITTVAMWTDWGALDARAGFIALLLDSAIFYFIFFGGIPRRHQKP